MKARDLFGIEIEPGDTVIAQDGDRLLIGKVTHYSVTGSVMIQGYSYFDKKGIPTFLFSRIVGQYYTSNKIIITRDSRHIHHTSNIKVKEKK